MRRTGRARIGTSGFVYDHWRGVFYPPDVPRSRWLEYYATRFDTVELNVTFYRLPGPQTFDSWRRRAPKGFCYAVKLSRYITHILRLRDCADALSTFVARAERLGPLLGPILVQLPPRWGRDLDRLDEFLGCCPKRQRWAVEFRDPSWLCEGAYRLLRARGVALCIHDLIEEHPREVTADFVYLRFHGAGEKYGGSYSAVTLRATARWVAERLSDGLDAFVYFNNDAHGYAAANAADLARRVAGR